MNDLTIVACANAHPSVDYLQRGFNAFKSTSHKYGYEPLILGWGEHWGGLGSKPKLLKKALDEGKIMTKYMMFVDAFDVVFLNDPSVILTVLPEDFNCILWNAERNCFPDGSLADLHPKTDSSFKYLNSGICISRTDVMHMALELMNVDCILDDHFDGTRMIEPNDQLYWQKAFLGQTVFMRLDTDCVFFQTLCGVGENEVVVKNGKLTNLETHTHPIAIHANGGAKGEPIWKNLLNQLSL